MKANIIIPSWKYWHQPLRAQPLTALYLATILEDNGAEVSITDFRDGEKVVEEADYYLYTICSPDLKECQGLAKKIKEKYPDSIHVAGGPHPTIFSGSKLDEFDISIAGPGEEFLYNLARSNKRVPFPKRHFLPEEKIVNDDLFKTDTIRSTTAQFSFGCPYACSFCANYSRGPIRRNSLEDISDEIDYLKSEYGIEGLSLQDEIVIPFKRKEAEEFLALLKSKNISWRGQTRALKDTSILKEAKESGLVELSFGLESVN